MVLVLSKQKAIRELQLDFSSRYPFLKLEFYKLVDGDPDLRIRKHLVNSVTLGSAGLKESGLLELADDLQVGELEKRFLVKFGLEAQVSRKAGNSWLETTLTDSWTLKKQNEHGREMSTLVIKYL